MYKTLIAPEDLAARLGAPGQLIIDVRFELTNHDAGLAAYRQSRIPGAVFLDVETQLAGSRTGRNGRHPLPARDVFHEEMASYGLTADTQVIIYDAQGGAMASRLWWMLRWLGHDAVAVLDGGWPAWNAAGLPVDDAPLSEAQARTRPGPAAAGFPVRPALVETVNADAVLANINQPAFSVVDARAAVRYRGETEPMDPVAGHIPGALNRPNSDNLGEGGRFKPVETLRADFTRVFGGVLPGQIVHQCGSGITACHNLLAMEHAGLTGSRLYPGSWSEWCSDPARPVARG